MARGHRGGFLRTVGLVAVIGGVLVGAGVYTGYLDFNANAKITRKGEQKARELREDTADFIRDGADKMSDEARRRIRNSTRD